MPSHSLEDQFGNGIILNIDKPEGWTSFDVVKKIRSVLSTRKVGHTGTLDPFATGVLLVCTGKATKKIDELIGCDKEYLAGIELGIQTDSHDIDGNIIKRSDTWKELTETDIFQVCKNYEGQIQQIPPMYSALKIQGKRLYHYARRGIMVHRNPRTVKVYSLDLENIELPFITIKVACSKGTYIRGLARDIGNDLQTGAYLKSLRRLKVGNYHIEDALTIDEFLYQFAS